MESFLRSATTEGQQGDAALKQADSIWRMLDQMAENDPDNYQKFINKHINEGKEFFALPEPELVAVTFTSKRNGKPDKRVFINFFSWSRVPASNEENGPIPMTGGRCNEGAPADSIVCCIGLAKKVFQDLAKKKGDEKEVELAAVVGVSMKYLEAKCGVPPLLRNCKVLEEQKSGGCDIKILRKTLMESEDSQEARKGISHMANELENAPADQREAILKRIADRTKPKDGASQASEIRTTSSGSDVDGAPKIRIPGSETGTKDNSKPKKNLIQEIKPEDRPLQKPVHSLNVIHKTNDHGQVIRELEVKVALPQLSHVSDLELDVSASDFTIFVPGFYQTEVLFPQHVNKEEAKAKFSRRSKMLKLKAPVLQLVAS